jgi:hypothetical protein
LYKQASDGSLPLTGFHYRLRAQAIRPSWKNVIERGKTWSLHKHLGAGLGLLFAPKAGHEIRHDIAEKVGEIGEHLRVTVPQPAPSTNGPST